MPIHPFFTDKFQARDAVKSVLAYGRLKGLEADVSTIDLGDSNRPLYISPFQVLVVRMARTPVLPIGKQLLQEL